VPDFGRQLEQQLERWGLVCQLQQLSDEQQQQRWLPGGLGITSSNIIFPGAKGGIFPLQAKSD